MPTMQEQTLSNHVSETSTECREKLRSGRRDGERLERQCDSISKQNPPSNSSGTYFVPRSTQNLQNTPRSGSQRSYISSAMVSLLGSVPHRSEPLAMLTIGGSVAPVQKYELHNLEFGSRFSPASIPIECIAISQITSGVLPFLDNVQVKGLTPIADLQMARPSLKLSSEPTRRHKFFPRCRNVSITLRLQTRFSPGSSWEKTSQTAWTRLPRSFVLFNRHNHATQYRPLTRHSILAIAVAHGRNPMT